MVKENELALVIAPLIFIMADNPAHSDIFRILEMTTLFPRDYKQLLQIFPVILSEKFTVQDQETILINRSLIKLGPLLLVRPADKRFDAYLDIVDKSFKALRYMLLTSS